MPLPVKPSPGSIVYERAYAKLRYTLTFHVMNGKLGSQDLEHFSAWHNDDRVAASWGQKGSIEEHAAYIDKLTKDEHALPLIASFNDEAFAYFEVYWAAQDHLAKFCGAAISQFDRGVHMLVGNQKWRGPHVIKRWLPGLLDYCFHDCKQTDIIWSEPKATNAKVINYMEYAGLMKQYEFDFPHKRAALMRCSRGQFYRKFGNHLEHLEDLLSPDENQ